MANDSRSLEQRILSRIPSRVRDDGISPQERSRVFQMHVNGFADLLMESVEGSLRDETAGIVAAKSWVGDAVSLVDMLFDDEQPFGASAETREAVLKELIPGIAARVDFAQISQPEPEEIRAHAEELAQVLLSNWFSLLERELAASTGVIPLAGFYSSSANEKIFEGVEAFALPVAAARIAFDRYGSSLLSKSGIAELTPTIHIRTDSHGSHEVCRPNAPPTVRLEIAADKLAEVKGNARPEREENAWSWMKAALGDAVSKLQGPYGQRQGGPQQYDYARAAASLASTGQFQTYQSTLGSVARNDLEDAVAAGLLSCTEIGSVGAGVGVPVGHVFHAENRYVNKVYATSVRAAAMTCVANRMNVPIGAVDTSDLGAKDLALVMDSAAVMHGAWQRLDEHAANAVGASIVQWYDAAPKNG